jgi:hypothetical protein
MLGCSGDPPPAPTEFDLPEVVNHGGPVLTTARIQPIYVADFPYGSEMDTFVSRLPGSAYWHQIGAEYGLGPAVALPGVTSVAALASVVGPDDATALVADVFASGLLPGLPRGDTIYALFFPSTIAVSVNGRQLCQGGLFGYHAEAVVAGVNVPMVVVADCGADSDATALSGAGAVSAILSHELVEAATDPFPDSAPAFADVDARHAVWSQALDGGELADLCENEAPNVIMPDDLGYPVQRIWSNAAVRAGTGPCVPVPPGEVYFVAVPRLPDTARLAGSPTEVAALVAPIASAATVEVDFRSEPDPPSSWQAVALEIHGDGETAAAGTVPPVSGTAGRSATLTVAAPPAQAGTFPLVIVSHAAGALHLWVGTIVRR